MAQTLGVFIRVFLVSRLKAALLSRFLVPLLAPDFRPVGSPQRVRNESAGAEPLNACAAGDLPVRRGGGAVAGRAQSQIYDRGWVSLACFGKLWRARSRVYRSQILQANIRRKALAETYTKHSFALF